MKAHVNLSIEYETYFEAKKKIKNFSRFFERVLESYLKNHQNKIPVFDGNKKEFKKEISDEELLRMLEED